MSIRVHASWRFACYLCFHLWKRVATTEISKGDSLESRLDEILELNNNRENDRTIWENNLKVYFSQKDVLRLLYVEEWRSERRKLY